MGLSYGLMGWHCSALPASWNVASWLLAMSATFALIWGWQLFSKLLLLTPRILVTMLFLSMALTLAVSFSTFFILLIVLFSSTLFARLELQAAGVNKFWTLVMISMLSGAMIGGGWYLGKHFNLQAVRAFSMQVVQLS
ncbi:MAG: hypothetical protein HC810_05105 [Acaryochloridaceae cyanobacterium RL_2_7]|nr:hypothetical protein [Acaryochloridaceae cyanobacterium RL_2_7]